MTEIVCLPGCPAELPAFATLPARLNLVAENRHDPDHVDRMLAQLKRTPGALLGGEHTPPLVWLRAVQCFPLARQLWFRVDSEQWWDLAANGPVAAEPPREAGKSPEPTATPDTPELSAAPPASELKAATSAPEVKAAPQATPVKPMVPVAATPVAARLPTAPAPVGKPGEEVSAPPEKNLVWESFLYASRGLDDPGCLREWTRVHEEALGRGVRDPRLLAEVENARRQGEHANELAQEMLRRMQQGATDDELRVWIDHETAGRGRKIKDHLEWKLRKERKWRQGKRQDRTASNAHSSLTAVKLVDGVHPNSLRHLPPKQRWTVLIDETGEVFDDRAADQPADARTVGRMVAVVLPEGARLPELKAFHGNAESSARVDQVLGDLLGAGAGIFGFTVKDAGTQAGIWIGHVLQLLRWVLWQLPGRPGEAIRVNCLIEGRDGYGTGTSLDPLAGILEDEFRHLDPARFARLGLGLSFMDKQHTLNGYVDAVAYTWGGTSHASKDRLKKSALLGHCLLRPSDQSMERLLLVLNREGKLLPGDWYELCEAAGSEPGGLIERMLDQLGERLREQPRLWQGYLDEVRARLRLKSLAPATLELALGWLERWTPAERTLPDTLRLQLEAAHLASENHRGQIHWARIKHCVQLAAALKNEIPGEACETILRVAVAASNNFEFAVLRPVIEEWLAEPVAVPGLLNHAKLHSTVGQLLAFDGQPEASLQHFDEALSLFARLSDPQQARREFIQTGIYRCIAVMDMPGASGEAVLAELSALMHRALDKSSPSAISGALARAGDDWRFLHHVWLRAMVVFPGALQMARSTYLELEGSWQVGDEHPWPLIEAYRAWLLRDVGKHVAAAEAMASAISACLDDGHGPTLHWMAEVLRTLAQALAIEVDSRPCAEARATLRQTLAQAPHDALAAFADAGALDHAAALAGLHACLPFNFH